MDNAFFALIARMRNIKRWGLMRNSISENVQEHSHMTAVIAHALAVIRSEIFGIPVDAGAVCAAALYHDASEIITGDLPSPVKYHNAELTGSFKHMESFAVSNLLELLPPALREVYSDTLSSRDSQITELVHAADKISAYIKCLEEKHAGNGEFRSAETQLLAKLEASPLPETAFFMENFMPAFGLTLDELTAKEQ